MVQGVVVVVGPVVVDPVVVVVDGPVVGRGGLGEKEGRGGSSSMHGIGRKTLPKGLDIFFFKTSSKIEFFGIALSTFKEVVIW